MVAGPTVATAQSGAIVGSWRGTSTCVDREHYPACKDEQLIFDVPQRDNAPDTLTIRVDKLVNGTRELMSEDVFTRQTDSSWTTEIRTPRFHGRLTLRVAGNRMTGTLMDLASDRRVREIVLERAP
jgi:hypothetical protein